MDNALAELQDCFSHTECRILEQQDLQGFTDLVLSYIKFCTDVVTVNKHIPVYPNQKLWMTSEGKSLMRARNTAFR